MQGCKQLYFTINKYSYLTDNILLSYVGIGDVFPCVTLQTVSYFFFQVKIFCIGTFYY